MSVSVVVGPGPGWLGLWLWVSLGVQYSVRGDICDSNPCENGGICLSGLVDEAFSCECPEGFTDPNCSSVVEVASDEEEPTSAGQELHRNFHKAIPTILAPFPA
uniref:EGF like repeats and discoidin domains 3 n=1 Tax=Ornithorhynchus anatinus TaxID=9258 RepID=A0A6I8MZB6_ORNAN